MVRRGYERVAAEYQSLLSRRWVLVAERSKDGPIDDKDTFRFCAYGLREIDQTALDDLRTALDDAEARLRVSMAEELSTPRVPPFRIDLLTDKLVAAGLPFTGVRSPEKSRSPGDDPKLFEYFVLSDGQVLAAFLSPGVTLTREQRAAAEEIVFAHEASLKPSLFRRAMGWLGLGER